MEEQKINNRVASLTSELVLMLLYVTIFNWFIMIWDLYSSFRHVFRVSLDFLVSTRKNWIKSKNADTKISIQKLGISENADEEEKLDRLEVEMVMEKLRNSCDPNEITGLFEEEEPSLQEVKEAFDIFDENGDGFIDAMELKKILSKLGTVAASEMECQGMIRTFDENGDGQIDFDEFVKLVENSFC